MNINRYYEAPLFSGAPLGNQFENAELASRIVSRLVGSIDGEGVI